MIYQKMLEVIEDLKARRSSLDACILALEKVLPVFFPEDAPARNSMPEHVEPQKARGEGRLLLRGKIWWICWSENGEERRESTGAVNEEEAQKLLADVVKGVKERKDQKIAERVGLAAPALPAEPEPPPLRSHEADTEPPAPKRRGRPPMIKRAMVDQALGVSAVAPQSTWSPGESISSTEPDPKCNRSSCVHTKSQHVGPNGKCVGCWCYGFVGGEQFAVAARG